MSSQIVRFGPHREPAVRVEKFEELTPAVVVWLRNCVICGASAHRMMIYGGQFTVQRPCPGTAVECVPIPPCCPAGRFAIHEETVQNGEVFRVIEEPPAKTATRERRKELVE